MQIILFLLNRKFRSYFHLDNWKGLVCDSVYTLLLLIYGAVLGIMYQRATEGTPQLILKSVSLSLLFVPLFCKFFPSFSLKKNIIPPQYPLNRFQRATIDLITFSLNRTIYYILLLFVFVFYFSAETLAVSALLELILIWLLGLLLAENLISALSWQKIIQLILIFVIVGIFYIFNRFEWSINRLLFLFFLNVILFFLFYIFYPDRIDLSHKVPNAKYSVQYRSYWRIVCRLLIGNKNALTTLLFGLLMINIVFPIAFLSAQRHNEEGVQYLFNKLPFFTVFFLPTILFTYVYNNLWGFYYNLSVNFVVIAPSFKKQLKLYLGLIIPGIGVSVLITISILLCFATFNWKMIVFYFIYCFLAVPIGFVSSSLRYRRMAENFDLVKLRANVSLVSTIIMFAIATLIGVFYSSKNVVLFGCCLAVVGLVMFLVLLKNERYLFKMLKNRLLSKRSF